MPSAPRFFRSAADFRRWLEANHIAKTELHVGFYKKDSGRSGLTYLEAVLEALCFGWIDGVMKRLDATRYMHRFTPRKPGSIWSNLNVARAEQLVRERRMAPAGLRAFEARTAAKTGIYAFERREAATFPSALEKQFRAHAAAWNFFSAQPPGYRRLLTHHVTSAKQEATRLRRLESLIAASARGERLR